MKFDAKILITLAIVALIGGVAGYVGISKKSQPVSNAPTQSPATVVGTTGTVTLTLWSWGDPALSPVIKAFEAQNPNIRIQMQSLAHNEVEEKIDLAIAAGSGLPDIIAAEGTIAPQYVRRGALLDITAKTKKYEKDFVSYKWPEVQDNQGHVYGLPWDAGPVGMFYRSDIFKREGIDPATIATWDDFISVGKRITKDTNGDGKVDQYMIAISQKNDVVDLFEMLLQQQDGSFFDADGNLTINNEKGLHAVQLIKRMVDEGITANIGYWTPEFYDELKKGHVATYIQAAWLGSFIKSLAPNTKRNWGVVAMPAFTPGGVRSSSNGGSNLAVSAQSKYPEEAWKFIEFALTRKDSQLAMATQYSFFPALKSVYDDPQFLKPDEFFGNQVTNRVFIDSQKSLPPHWHYGPYYREATKLLDPELIAVLTGKKSAVQALQDASARIEAVIKSGK